MDNDPTALVAQVLGALERAEYLEAVDDATAALRQLPEHDHLNYLRLLALARSGATDGAVDALHTLGWSDTDALPAAIGAVLAQDIASLGARLSKDRAFSASGAQRRVLAAEAAQRYEQAYDIWGSAYPCVNAATLWALAGDDNRAQALALKAADSAAADSVTYWSLATQAEAALLTGRIEDAVAHLGAAASISEGSASRATTLRQLTLICELKQLDLTLLDVLRPPPVAHYCGILMTDDRPSAELRQLAAQLIRDERVAIAYGSLACGADLIWADALLEAGVELHAVLPCPPAQFEKTSVRVGGAGWLPSYQRALDQAASVTWLSNDHRVDDSAYEHCSSVAMGRALVRARHLFADAVQLSMTRDGPAPVHTSRDNHVWQRAGHRTAVLTLRDVGSPTPPPDPSPALRRRVAAMLFGDVKGFSRLHDGQIEQFVGELLAPMAAVVDSFGSAVLHRSTWGDGFYLVLDEPLAAARCALALQRAFAAVDLAAAGLPTDLGLRIGCHAGPVLNREDPFLKQPGFYGAEVTRTARIEPQTPEGEVYVTEVFAALLALDLGSDAALQCDYVGHIPTPKGYGPLRMHVLREVPPA